MTLKAFGKLNMPSYVVLKAGDSIIAQHKPTEMMSIDEDGGMKKIVLKTFIERHKIELNGKEILCGNIKLEWKELNLTTNLLNSRRKNKINYWNHQSLSERNLLESGTPQWR